ncbi:hypothetical protein K0M31_006398 [Melipona bicolor]|uniref:Uncharacterized protein n=1 Tax=Melipona bicolor TaxID=60889 RepID=A0AA40FTG9_9HYME|nr:hypothetical protein K0M31_006398 [Melipona bicolor]
MDRPEECKSSFIGALVLTRRLGNAAKLNVKVFMRQPTDLARPTPVSFSKYREPKSPALKRNPI